MAIDERSLAAKLAARLTKSPEEKVKAIQTRKARRAMTLRDYEMRGNNARIREMTHVPELILVGAAGTGKTLAVVDYLHEIAWTYPKARILMVRKVRADLANSVLVTFERDILGEDNPICANMQRKTRDVYRYPNGSEIVVGGMDRPGRILSAEYDIIYVAEASQISLEDWETLVMRNRSTVVPWQQVIGDTNPDRPDHWIKQREQEGALLLLNTYHEDNPKYYDVNLGDWTAAGVQYVLGKLARLTGVRRDRYKDGKWTSAEGAIYDEWSERHHLIDPFEIPREWRRFRVVDFGYNNPFVCQWWAMDGDGRMYLYREIYMTGRLVRDHAAQINRMTEQLEVIEATVCDHDAEGMATLRSEGIKTTPAKKAVSTGIEAVKDRMRIQGDGKPRLFIMRGCWVELDQDLHEAKLPTSTVEEIPGYVWADGKKKEEPVKEHDHGVDAMRYAVMYLDASGSKRAAAARAVGLRGGRRRGR